MQANNAFERAVGHTWAASGRGMVISAGRSTQSLDRIGSDE